MTTLYDYVEIVRQSRERTDSVFPLPDVDSCIDYAITEAGGEHLEALLRERRTGDKRNRDKEHDARTEWGQTGYMICSAIIQQETGHLDWVDWEPYVPAADGNLYVVIARLCDIRTGLAQGDPPTVDALDQWNAYTELCGWNPADLLRETCAAFERKHLPGATISYTQSSSTDLPVLPVVRGYDFEPVGKLFRYPVMSAEDAAKQGEQAE